MRRLWILLGLALLAGCGYAPIEYVDQTDGKTPVLHIPIFGNITTRRNLEPELTERVVREMLKQSPYRIGDASRADLVLEGAITSYSEPTLAEGPDDAVLAGSVRVKVDCTLVRVGANGVRRKVWSKSFTGSGSISPAIGESELTGRAEAFHSIAQSIVRSFEKGW
jgi:hypothetical protein